MLYRLCQSKDDNLLTYVPLTSLSETIKRTYAGGRIFLDQPLILALCLPKGAAGWLCLGWVPVLCVGDKAHGQTGKVIVRHMSTCTHKVVVVDV